MRFKAAATATDKPMVAAVTLVESMLVNENRMSSLTFPVASGMGCCTNFWPRGSAVGQDRPCCLEGWHEVCHSHLPYLTLWSWRKYVRLVLPREGLTWLHERSFPVVRFLI